MICFRDKTFCVSPNCENKCGYKLTDEIKKEADKWWGKGEGQAPISMSYFCGEDE